MSPYKSLIISVHTFLSSPQGCVLGDDKNVLGWACIWRGEGCMEMQWAAIVYLYLWKPDVKGIMWVRVPETNYPSVLHLLSHFKRTRDFAVGPSRMQLHHPDLNSASCVTSPSFMSNPWPSFFSNLWSRGRLPTTVCKHLGHDVNPKKTASHLLPFSPTQKSFPLTSLPGILMLCSLSIINTHRKEKKGTSWNSPRRFWELFSVLQLGTSQFLV